MPHLSLSFLGGFEVRLDGESLTAFGADKVRALLAFLVTEAARPHRRAELGNLLWPDLPENKAAHNLSQTLLRLRSVLREPKAAPDPPVQPFLLLTRHDVQFNPLADYRLDVAVFNQLLQAHGKHRHSNAETCPVCVQWLHQAAELYRGDLLAGFFVRDSLGFEEWRLARQEVLHRQALEALTRLTTYHEQHGEYDRVQDYARRLIKLEPWGDRPHLQLMRVFRHAGQTAAALAQYETYRRVLADELGLEPSAAATALYEEIKAADSGRPSAGDVGQPDRHSLRSPGERRTLGERRQATVMICGRAFAPAGHDPEELHDHMSSCREQCERTVNQFGGYRLRRQGDKCLILFGYPQALEDAPRRAVDAGLTMTNALTGDGEISIGIHTGVIVEGARHGSQGDPEIFSEAPGVARACQSLADPGTVVVTEDTEQLVRGLFDCESLGAHRLGDTARMMGVYRASGKSGTLSRLDWLAQTRRLTTFLGREPERQRLLAAWQTAQRGQGQVVWISGDSGLGKSRLMLEFKNALLRASDHQPPTILWLESRCSTYYQNTSLHPIIGLLQQLLDCRADDGPDVKRDKLLNTLVRFDLAHPAAVWLLSLLLGLPTDTPAPESITAEQRTRMREVFVALVQKRAAAQPLLLVIEDLHWSDPSTVEWLGQSFDSLATGPCLMLLTSRPNFAPAWSPRPHLLSLTLGPLSPIETEQMLADLVGHQPLRDSIRQRIITQTDGIPLFIEELTRTVLESSSQTFEVSETSKALPEIPATLRDSLTARLDHVGAAKETAQRAAVLGREFSYPILRAISPFDEDRLQRDLSRLMEADLIYRQEQSTAAYSFKHRLVQGTAYASLLKRTRQDYHRRIAEMLEARFTQIAETQPEILAQHYSQADLPNEAVDYWLRAGDHATAQGATQEARTFFDRALALIEPTDRERRWWALLGREAVLNLREERAAQSLDVAKLLELAEALDDDTRRAEALLRQAIYANHMEDFQLMLQASEAAVAAAARHGNMALEVMALSRKIVALARLEQWAAARLLIDEVLAKLPEVKDEAIQYYGLSALGMYYSDIGDLAHSLQLALQSAEMARRVGDRSRESGLLANVGLHYAKLGLYALARAVHEQGLVLAEVVGDRRLQTNHRYDLCYVLWCSGDRDNARALGEQALRELRTSGYRPHGIASCLTYLGMMSEDAGDYIIAAAYLKESRALLAGLSSLHGPVMEVQAIEARCLLALGQREDAQQLAAEVWVFINAHGTMTIDFPARVYLCIADVVAQVPTPGVSERDVLDAGYAELRQRAEMINDPEWRRSFIEDEVSNKALIARWQRIKGADFQRNIQG